MDTDIAESFSQAFKADYDLKHFKLKAALADARDIMGGALARSWGTLDNHRLTYVNAGYAVCDALQDAGHGNVAETVIECLAWREILNPFDSTILTAGRSRVWI